ncbi:MAG: EAL domain-containing protein [Cellvibrionaceae bacterium]|nr:EAL domain-containing protein [Cellvibrionaceae bacterium]
MNIAANSFRLIIINDSPKEAQRLSSMFQNAGKPCRAQHVTTEASFNKVIEEKNWDLAVIYSDTPSLTPAAVIHTIRRFGHDLPVILMTDDCSERATIDGMKLGACDVVQLDDDQHLLLVVERELDYREYRKRTRITERKLKEIERRNQQLLDSSKDGIAFIQDGLFIYVNDSFAEILGYPSRDDIESLPLMDMVSKDDQEHVKQVLKNFPLTHDSQTNHFLSFHQPKETNHHDKKIDVELKLTDYEEESCIQLLIQANLSDNELLEAELQTIKYTDTTTGLHNKNYLLEQLENSIYNAADTEQTQALLYIDIDNFVDKVEGSVGIDGAEKVLASTAEILHAHKQDHDILARISDHAFAIITNEHNIEKLLNAGNLLCEMVRENFFEIKNKTLRITISIGITLINDTAIDTQTTINHATQAIENMRKQHNKGDSVNLYQTVASNQPILFNTLQKAISNNEFKLLFQPIISLRGENQELYEVLLRMIDENQEEISPNQFLQAAADMQVTTKIDRWVILEAIKHLANHDSNSATTHLIINISYHTLCDESFFSWLRVALNAAKVNPGKLTLQSRESDVTQHLTTARSFINSANTLGIHFSLSHFGCALDHLSLLEHIDVDQIKIDGSFSLEVQENPESSDALETLLQALHDRKKITTVPFVENANILSKLWKMGTHYIQGHYLQPPSAAMNYDFTVES